MRRYVVSFVNGDEVEVEADEKWDASRKAKEIQRKKGIDSLVQGITEVHVPNLKYISVTESTPEPFTAVLVANFEKNFHTVAYYAEDEIEKRWTWYYSYDGRSYHNQELSWVPTHWASFNLK